MEDTKNGSLEDADKDTKNIGCSEDSNKENPLVAAKKDNIAVNEGDSTNEDIAGVDMKNIDEAYIKESNNEPSKEEKAPEKETKRKGGTVKKKCSLASPKAKAKSKCNEDLVNEDVMNDEPEDRCSKGSLSTKLFSKKRKKIQVIESDPDSDVSVDFAELDTVEPAEEDAEDIPSDTEELGDEGSQAQTTEEESTKPDPVHSKPELSGPHQTVEPSVSNISTASPSVRNAFAMMMSKRPPKEPVVAKEDQNKDTKGQEDKPKGKGQNKSKNEPVDKLHKSAGIQKVENITNVQINESEETQTISKNEVQTKPNEKKKKEFKKSQETKVKNEQKHEVKEDTSSTEGSKEKMDEVEVEEQSRKSEDEIKPKIEKDESNTDASEPSFGKKGTDNEGCKDKDELKETSREDNTSKDECKEPEAEEVKKKETKDFKIKTLFETPTRKIQVKRKKKQ